MDVSKIGLLRDSSEESFEHIDPDFDDSYYPELRGVAVAEYLPVGKDEVQISKGSTLLYRCLVSPPGVRTCCQCCS